MRFIGNFEEILSFRFSCFLFGLKIYIVYILFASQPALQKLKRQKL